MILTRFDLYEEDGKKGLVDRKTGRVILHSSYNVEKIVNSVIILKSGERLFLEDLLKTSDYFSNKQRYMIVENISTRLVGVFDNKTEMMKIYCDCAKIEYSRDKKGFVIYKGDKKRQISYSKLKYLKCHLKKEGVIRLKNLSVYNCDTFLIDSSTGKKVDNKR